MVDPGAKDQGDDEVAEAQQQRLANPHRVLLAVEDAEVERQQHQHEQVEAEPHPEGIYDRISLLSA
jgi:sulfur carrier protein ThiS